MISDEEGNEKDDVRRQLFAHIVDLQDRCLNLLAARDPFGVYNEVPALRSIIGQIASASHRYRELS